MTSVCSVGIDMVAVPGDVPASTISAIIADEMAIGTFNNKTTAVRIIPVPGKTVGDTVHYGGLARFSTDHGGQSGIVSGSLYQPVAAGSRHRSTV